MAKIRVEPRVRAYIEVLRWQSVVSYAGVAMSGFVGLGWDGISRMRLGSAGWRYEVMQAINDGVARPWPVRRLRDSLMLSATAHVDVGSARP